MSQAHERIIANVPRVTKGNKGNGAIYKFWLVYIGNFQPISFVILLLSIKYAPSHTNSRAGLSKSIQSRRSECAASAPLLFLVQHGLTCSYKSKQCRECGKKKKKNQTQNKTTLTSVCISQFHLVHWRHMRDVQSPGITVCYTLGWTLTEMAQCNFTYFSRAIQTRTAANREKKKKYPWNIAVLLAGW